MEDYDFVKLAVDINLFLHNQRSDSRYTTLVPITVSLVKNCSSKRGITLLSDFLLFVFFSDFDVRLLFAFFLLVEDLVSLEVFFTE